MSATEKRSQQRNTQTVFLPEITDDQILQLQGIVYITTVKPP